MRKTNTKLGMLAYRIAGVFIDTLTHAGNALPGDTEVEDNIFRIVEIIKAREDVDFTNDNNFRDRVRKIVTDFYTWIDEVYPTKSWYEAGRALNRHADYIVSMYVAVMERPDTHAEIAAAFSARHDAETAADKSSVTGDYDNFVAAIFRQLWQYGRTETYIFNAVRDVVLKEQHAVYAEAETDTWRIGALENLIGRCINGTAEHPGPAEDASVDSLLERSKLLADVSYDVWYTDGTYYGSDNIHE